MVMNPTETTVVRLSIPELPLAVYREVAAHLQQVEGVTTELHPQTSGEFNYHLSQVGSISVEYPGAFGQNPQLQEILDYYGQRFSPWQVLDSSHP